MAVIAYHLIWTNYGTWLPNDLRGSGSHDVYTPSLAELGRPHFGRKKIQATRSMVRQFCEEAQSRLQFPVIRFDASQREVIAAGFAHVILSQQFTCYACALMPDHVHLVVRKHRHQAEEMIELFQEESRRRLGSTGAVSADHPMWTKNGWKVYLDTPEAVWSRIRYVERNPLKEGPPRQSWPFVVPYDNWPFHRQGTEPRPRE